MSSTNRIGSSTTPSRCTRITAWRGERLDQQSAAIDDVFSDVRTVIDVGAGSGATAAQAARTGKRVQACEKSRVGRLIGRMQGVRGVPFDLRKEKPAEIDGPADLAYCFEVAEHLPQELGDRLVTFVAGLAPIIVFSAAQPGQGGLAHINEQPLTYWRDRFCESGCEFDPGLDRAVPSEREEPWRR